MLLFRHFYIHREKACVSNYFSKVHTHLKTNVNVYFRDWLQDDLMKIHTDDENEPVWVPFGLKVQLQENGSLKIEEYADDDPLPDEIGM